jgi:OPA family glycerol-3-phosphate transporter-like MFS transporter
MLSFGCTIVRETFNTWTPVYLRDHVGFSLSHSAGMSAIFPGVGAASVLLAGWLSDRLGLNGRSLLMFLGLATTVAALVALMSVRSGPSGSLLAVTLIGVVAFCLLGPYSYLGGAFALDFGGKQASAASSGIIDGIGYLGGVLAGDTVARLAVAYGWQGVFVSLAAVSAVAAICAGILHGLNTRAAHTQAPHRQAAHAGSGAETTRD